ncbi:MAG: helix-turn-helix transcriptional regulator, partial [Syntrophobacteraceae bacterium]
MSPYAQRLKSVRSQIADQRGMGKLSQAAFAKLLEVHPSAISHVEAGNTRIQPDLAKTIEEKTGFRQAWLLTGEGPERIEAPPQETQSFTEPQGKLGEPAFSFVKKIKPLLSSGSGDFVYDEECEDIYS